MDAPPPADRTRFFTSMNPSVSASAALASSSESELLDASSSDAKSFSSAGTSPSSTLLGFAIRPLQLAFLGNLSLERLGAFVPIDDPAVVLGVVAVVPVALTVESERDAIL
jgi:hypothetical protein